MKRYSFSSFFKIGMLILSMMIFVCTFAYAEVQTVNLTQSDGVTCTTTVGQNSGGLIDGTNTKADGTYTDDDGNTVYYAWSYWSKSEEYAVVDLGSRCNITQIVLYLGYPGSSYSKGPEAFEIYYSNNQTDYTLIDSKSGITAGMYSNGIYTKNLDTNIKARYIKLLIPQADEAREVRVREIEIYGNHMAETAIMSLSEDVSVSASIGDNYSGLIDGTNTEAAGTYTDDEGNTAYYAWSYWSKNEEYAVVDLGRRCNINQIILYLGYSGSAYSKGPEAFEIYSSDNLTDYTLVASETDIASKNYADGIYIKDFGFDIEARYIKLVIPGVDAAREVRVREIEIYGAEVPDAEIISLAQDVSCSSSNGTNFSGLIDGTNNQATGSYTDEDGNTVYYAWSYWSKNEEYAVVDLGYSYNVSKIMLYLGYPGSAYSDGPEAFGIYYSNNNIDYTLIEEKSDITSGTYTNGIYTKVLDYPVKARYIKLVIPGADASRAIRVREMEIYGKRDLPAKILYPNYPSYLQDKDSAVLNVSIAGNLDMQRTYTIEYSANGDFADAVTKSGTVAAGETADIEIDLSSLKKGKYPDFCARVYINGIPAEELSCPVTLIDFAEKVPFSEYARIGLNWHIDKKTPAYSKGIDVENYNKLMSNMGITNTRSLHRWAWLETTKGEREIDKHDYVQNIMVKYGQNFSPYILGFGNPLYYEEEPVTYQNVIDTIEYNTQMIDQLEKVGVGVKSLEIWNEPNLSGFWGSERWITYSQLANRMAFEMKKLYPNKEVMGGAISSTGSNNTTGEDFMKDYLRRGALMYVDEISCHPYTFTYNPDNRHLSRAGDFVSLRDEAGGWLNVTVSEVGYPTHINSWGVTDAVQAQYLPKYFVYNDELDVALTDLYTFEDTGNDVEDREHNFGIIQTNFVPKEGYVSMAQLIKWLRNAEYVGRFLIDDNAYAYVYVKPDEIFAVTWSHEQDYSFSYTLPDGAAAEDLYGNPIQAENGTVTVDSNPVYISGLLEDYLLKAVEAQTISGFEEIRSDVNITAINEKTTELQNMFLASNITNSDVLKENIEKVYAYGSELTENYKEYEMTLKDLSIILSKLHRIAKRCAFAYAYYDIAQDISDDYERVNQLVTLKKGTEPDSSLLYTDAIMRFAKRYNEKAKEIGENYTDDIAGKKGLRGIYDMMAKNLSLWSEKIMEYETPDLSRAVFTYLSNTNPVINKGQTVSMSVTVENLLAEHDINGNITVTDESGNILGKALPCVVEKGTAEEIAFEFTLPYLDADKVLLYVDIYENESLFKRSEMEVTVSQGYADAAVSVLNLELYNNESKLVNSSDIVFGNTLKAVCAVSASSAIDENTQFIIAQYKNEQLHNAEAISVYDAFNQNSGVSEIEISRDIPVGENVDKISLFVWDISSLECMTYKRKVEKQ